MKPDPKRQRKLLDWQLCNVSNEKDASFMERDMSLFSIKRNLIGRILKHDAIRLKTGEQTCRLDPIGKRGAVIGNFQFWRHPGSSILIHKSKNLSINLMPDTFRADAEEVLQCLHEEGELLWRIAPTEITIGLVPDIMSSLAEFNPASGEIYFFANRSGGLRLSGMAHFTKHDAFSVSSRQVIIHELTHALERSERVQENASLVANGIKAGDYRGKHRDVVESLPAPDFPDIHIESMGARIAYKVDRPTEI